jgi:hypothetical protein
MKLCITVVFKEGRTTLEMILLWIPIKEQEVF